MFYKTKNHKYLCNIFPLSFQTFYRENVEMKSPIKANPNNDFMPNFTTTKEPESQNASSVISQWEKLPELRQEDELQEDEPDESFSEMKPSKAAMMQENNTTPVRKVVGQLKSELELRLEEAKKPQTWANAVKNEKPVVIINPNDTCPPTKPDQPESPEKNSDNKENEKEVEEINEAKEARDESPVWILPQEEPKKKKKKKKVKKED